MLSIPFRYKFLPKRFRVICVHCATVFPTWGAHDSNSC